MESVDVVVVGGGQAGLAAGYFLRRAGLSYVILDAEPSPGGAWRHAWKSLHLFSPAEWSSIPGWPMPAAHGPYPDRAEVIDYLTRYEQKYTLPVTRPVFVDRIDRSDEGLIVSSTDGRRWRGRAVISATGTWRRPYVPPYDGLPGFAGQQMHSGEYTDAAAFAGKRVAIIGGGNSGAQILAEVSEVAETIWITEREPEFLPDAVDGRLLFQRATEKWKAQQEGRAPDIPAGGFGDIVMVAPVKDARARGVLTARRPPVCFTPEGMRWEDGVEQHIDAVIWCTGFRPALSHLRALGVINDRGLVAVDASRVRSVAEPSVWLLGYGDWNGAASATLVGVTRYAREAVNQATAFLAAADA
ncbi:ArsO family NAD(P)H-dependent flavin-containing monooxygenase [Luteimonas terrae]|uniref:Cation diffusion facilitator CzcD-associated flavoprotein CzcO n=1 Tax=Luteimonas terrae TaxID=1530191 RepID=A0ABU1XTA2_9GAMM|nr:ArsO family NAD(P)H-dependent flavin-containing monooxygenase [Luteimonas terrae]MDR7191986.1 cation diffusion facilitator CzcD-associated flavoprotein CzcO [Luteimonas terrae]